MASSNSQLQLLQLPIEILTTIPISLPNRDIKNLRLTCKLLCNIAPLRLDRVFLSPHLCNLEVFRAIAQHETYRQQITEIVWDDALLRQIDTALCRPNRCSGHPPGVYCDLEYWDIDGDDNGDNQDDDDSDDSDDDGGIPYTFTRVCKKMVQELKRHINLRPNQPDSAMLAKLVAPISLERSWKHYQELVRQQLEAMATNADAEAFKYGLQRFPALRRVTITPAAHGWHLGQPLYETPMIRSFPPSFNYPIPFSWPIELHTSIGSILEYPLDYRWRAFRLAARALAANPTGHCVTEFVIDVNQLLTGLDANIFNEDCEEQRELLAIVRQPNFRRLDLPLVVFEQDVVGWRALKSGCLRRTLAAAPALEHFTLATDLEEGPDPEDQDSFYDPPGDGYSSFFSLFDLFPIHIWTRLRHFGLSRYPVHQGDLISLLKAMSPTLRSVELSFLFFRKDHGNYRDLLTDMRDQLGWRERPVGERPHVAIGLPEELDRRTRAIWADRPVEEYLYHDGANPFGADGWGVNQIPHGWGGVVRDSFDPSFERPWAEWNELEQLGHIDVKYSLF